MKTTTSFAVMLTAAAFSLGCASPAAAQFGDLLRNVAPMIPAATAAARPAPATAATTSSQSSSQPSGQSGAMGLREPTALPPLHRLGTDAVAVVESASGTTAVRPMDYVFAKQTISLGGGGRLTMSYLSGCLTEVIQGGTVAVAAGGSKVTGGKRQERVTPGCRAAKPVILASASEAGATVNRVTPFSNAVWDERALKSAQPVFKWDKALGAGSIRVKNMDKDGEPVVWQIAVTEDFIAYPPKGPSLTPGAPFKAEALSGDKVVASALFSIDPALDVADNLANRVVPLTKP